MTTSVHVVNLGPQPIEVKFVDITKKVLYPRESENFYVFDTQSLTIVEQLVKPPESCVK